jgi:hypothetical protein
LINETRKLRNLVRMNLPKTYLFLKATGLCKGIVLMILKWIVRPRDLIRKIGQEISKISAIKNLNSMDFLVNDCLSILNKDPKTRLTIFTLRGEKPTMYNSFMVSSIVNRYPTFRTDRSTKEAVFKYPYFVLTTEKQELATNEHFSVSEDWNNGKFLLVSIQAVFTETLFCTPMITNCNIKFFDWKPENFKIVIVKKFRTLDQALVHFSELYQKNKKARVIAVKSKITHKRIKAETIPIVPKQASKELDWLAEHHPTDPNEKLKLLSELIRFNFKIEYFNSI